jgi:hypothetical protein
MVGDVEKTVNLGPRFLASVVFTITLADHAPWDKCKCSPRPVWPGAGVT